MTIRWTLVLVALATLCACEPPEGPGTTGPRAAAPSGGAGATAAGASVTGGRTLSDSGRVAMKEQLAGESAVKKAWILSQPGNPEVAALVASLTGVFQEAGWEVKAETVSGISLKAGLMTLIGEEQYPPYIDVVMKSFEASGLEVKSASGYRGYYESKKQENPGWPGVALRADQDFVIVVGPKPTA